MGRCGNSFKDCRQVKKAIASFGFDRPEMMVASFEAIRKNKEYSSFDWFCYLDGQGRAQRAFYQEDYPDIRFHIHDQRIGLNANILWGFKDLFKFYNYDYIIYVEDDVLVGDDFIRCLEYCHFNLRADDIFTITGFSRTHMTKHYGYNAVCKFKWYHPWGVLIDRNDFALIEPHIDRFVEHPIDYMEALGGQIKEADPDYFKREYSTDGKPVNITQDCLINAIRAINGKYQLMPVHSRSQNMGFYGTHQPGDYNGEDCTSPETHKRSMHATDCFRPHYGDWEKLHLVEEIQY